MKRIFKKALSLVLVMALSLALSISAFADDSRVEGSAAKDSSIKDSGISYISQSDAALLANQCIKDQIAAGDHCTWNSTTKINETVNLYDFNNQINAYLFRLKTDNKKEGYIFVRAYKEAPDVLAFGYDCNFILDQASAKYSSHPVNNNDHIIYSGGLTFLKGSSSQKVRNVITNSMETDSLETLNSLYHKSLLKTKDEKSKANLEQLTNKIQPNYQIMYDQDDIDNLWNTPTSNICLTSDFTQDNNCAATASTNLIYYWSHIRPNPTIGLWGVNESASSVESKLYTALYTNIGVPGTMPWNIIPGLSKYSLSCGFGISGSDKKNFETSVDWSWFTGNVHHNIPILITVVLDPKYQQHVMLTVGYQDTSTGKYLRVADGGVRSFSNFYRLTNDFGTREDYMLEGCYTRW